MASVTYRAPAGDSEVVVMLGVKFFNGIPVEVLDAASIARFVKNPHFDVSDDVEDDVSDAAEMQIIPRKRGRPRKIAIEGGDTSPPSTSE
jgi:hypothetical protein